MIFKIAWRNVWRNVLRSSVVIFSIIVGIWAGIFMLALNLGVNESRTKSQIENFVSHIQVHHSEFIKDKKIKYSLTDIESLEEVIKNNSHVKAYSKRIIYNEGFFETTKGNGGIKLIGINPKEELLVTKMYDKVIEGNYFDQYKGKPIYISDRMAEKYGKEIGKPFLVKSTDIDGNPGSIKFKVVGIFKTVSLMHDAGTAYVLNTDLAKVLKLENQYHEIAILLEDRNEAKSVTKEIQKELDQETNLIEYWGKVSPDLGFADEMGTQTLFIFMGIIMLALLFGIINTMLMAVLERKRELGMLISVGMTKTRVFFMIVLETLFLALIGGPIGIFLGDLTIGYYGSVGINLSSVGEGMSTFGVANVLYPAIDASAYPQVAIMVIITALIGALFPARKALKLKPADAVRAI